MPKHPKWTQARVSEGKVVATTRILTLVQMTTRELEHEFTTLFSVRSSHSRDTLLRYLVLQALDHAFPDTLTLPAEGPSTKQALTENT